MISFSQSTTFAGSCARTLSPIDPYRRRGDAVHTALFLFLSLLLSKFDKHDGVKNYGRTDGHTCDQNLSLDCVRACVRACVLAFSYRRSQRVLIDMVHTVFDERKIEVDDTLCIRVARIVDDTGGIVIS